MPLVYHMALQYCPGEWKRNPFFLTFGQPRLVDATAWSSIVASEPNIHRVHGGKSALHLFLTVEF